MRRLEVGRTPLRKNIELCGRCNGAQVYVKDESKNPFGTFKDRRCAALLDEYKDRPELVFVHITSGNSGYSLARLAKEFEEKEEKKRTVVNIVPKGISKTIKKRLEAYSIVHEMDLGKGIVTPDEMREIAREVSGYNGADTNILGVESFKLERGYGEIISEIRDEGIKPDYIFCPVGEGELAAELAIAASTAWRSEKVELSSEVQDAVDSAMEEENPKIIGVTVKQNAIVHQKDFLKDGKKSIADKLLNCYSKFKNMIIDFIKRGRMEVSTVTEGEIAKEYRYLNRIGINVEPSAAVAFVGAAKYDLKPDDVVVVINSGKGIYDQKAVERVWVQKLKRSMRNAAVFVLGAGVALGLTKGFMGYYRIKREKLVAEATYYAHEEGDNKSFDIEMHERACRFLRYQRRFPPIESKEDIRDRCKNKYIWDFPDGHLRYYVKYKKAEAGGTLGYDGGIWISQMRKLTDRYRNGEFDVQIKAPSKTLRLIGK